MNKEELKKMLKPLIKECIKEVFFEPGLLSTVIKEVLRGTDAAPLLENKRPRSDSKVEFYMEGDERQVRAKPEEDSAADEREYRRKKLNETRSKLLDSIGRDAFKGVDVFADTEPLSKGGALNEESSPGSPLSIYKPNDPGVDITKLGIFGKKRR